MFRREKIQPASGRAVDATKAVMPTNAAPTMKYAWFILALVVCSCRSRVVEVETRAIEDVRHNLEHFAQMDFSVVDTIEAWPFLTNSIGTRSSINAHPSPKIVRKRHVQGRVSDTVQHRKISSTNVDTRTIPEHWPPFPTRDASSPWPLYMLYTLVAFFIIRFINKSG